MLIKAADDKSKRLALLEDLQRSTLISATQRKWLREELSRLRKGIQGERDSAHYIDSHFKDSPNHFILHDLRLVVDGDVAQIDHLLINRAGTMFLLETKNYAGSMLINAQGEFTAVYDDDRFGIESPIEQSKRHERVLSKLLERLELVGRTQKKPDFHHVVMMHPKAVIERPPPKAFDTSNVIKADQFPSWHAKLIDTQGIGSVLRNVLNVRSQETMQEWAEKLVRQHRPADLLSLPDFIRPKEKAPQPAPVRTPAPSPDAGEAQPPAVSPRTKLTSTAQSSESPAPAATQSEPAKRLICATCGAKISYPEGKFCWNNAKRFGGLQYCREHQAAFT
jgi:hypothetical protein